VARALIADDDPGVRALIRMVAIRAGFEVDMASNGADALASLRSNSYVVALIDLMMPTMSGHDLLEIVGSLATRPTVIVVTAMHDLHDLDSDVVSLILRKPFDVEMLYAILSELRERSTRS
jgi:two-component system nitrogen regulation response regulator GlnG